MLSLSGYDATHSKILESGIKNFLKDGYEKSNLRKICKEAGVTTGAFYRHFDDKENTENERRSICKVRIFLL